jgi:hypothetical protein
VLMFTVTEILFGISHRNGRNIFYFRKIFLHRTNQIIISGFNDLLRYFCSPFTDYKTLHEHKEKCKK